MFENKICQIAEIDTPPNNTTHRDGILILTPRYLEKKKENRVGQINPRPQEHPTFKIATTNFFLVIYTVNRRKVALTTPNFVPFALAMVLTLEYLISSL